MLSYRHGFHAGNHADVLKHVVQISVLERLMAKPKPLVYFDTHSAAGIYSLDSDVSLKTGEFEAGVARLFGAMPKSLGQYGAILDALNPEGQLRQYPGSPEIARRLLRPQDRLVLMELHNNEVQELRRHMRGDDRVAIHHRDGFEGLVALTPPAAPLPKRGMVLIDPAYEVKTDYQQVVDTVKRAHQRWSTGVYLVWYPLLAEQRDQSQRLLRGLAGLLPKSLLVVELSVEAQAEDFGMHGSGMAVINAPWQLDENLQSLVGDLQRLLSSDQGAQRIEWLIAPK